MGNDSNWHHSFDILVSCLHRQQYTGSRPSQPFLVSSRNAPQRCVTTLKKAARETNWSEDLID